MSAGPIRLAGNAQIAAVTALRSVLSDPATFGMQLVRRFPTFGDAPLELMLRTLPKESAALVAAWREGEREQLAAALHEAAASTRGLDAFGAEIATAAGHPDLVVDDPRQRPVARARAAWMLGEMELAEQLAPERSRYRKALRAERAIMTPGNRLRVGSVETQGGLAGDAVLHILTNSLPHTQSGYTVRSHSILLAQRSAGLHVEAITRAGYPVVVGGLAASAEDAVDGITYRRILPSVLASLPDQRLMQQVRGTVAYADQVGAGVLHTTTNYANGVVAQAAAEALGVPWTYEVRGMQEQTWVSTLESAAAQERALASERYRLIRAREAQLADEADAVFTLSEGMADDLAGRGVDRETISIMPNGIPSSRLDKPVSVAADARADLGLSREGFWVGAVSSLVGYEGFDTLVDAVIRLRDEGVDARLLLVGDGVSRPALLTQAEVLGDAAVLPGRVPLEQAQLHLAALDAVVVPRKDLDVTRSVAPLKPIEALAAGKPLIVSDLPPLVETIGPELAAAGTVVPPEDVGALAEALQRLASDSEMRSRLSDLGRARAATRTWEQIGADYRDSYLTLD